MQRAWFNVSNKVKNWKQLNLPYNITKNSPLVSRNANIHFNLYSGHPRSTRKDRLKEVARSIEVRRKLA